MAQCFKQTAAQGRKLQRTHRGANLALSQHIQSRNDQAVSSQLDVVQVQVEEEESDIITEDGSSRYHALLWAQLHIPVQHELNAEGPWRNKKKEANKDAEALRKAFAVEGEAGVKRVAACLERKNWTPKELDSNDDTALDGLIGRVEGLKQEKLIPPGEGWTRATDDMLWDPRSEVYFVQSGDRMGQYLMKDKTSKEFEEVDPPHKGIELPIVARAAGANAIRRGAKLERTVLLNDLPKISRLALKFPLSFVDSPAGAFALFQGIRTAEAADWCAKNFHTKLIPMLATRIHNWETKDLQSALKTVLQDLDAELLKSTHAYSGCGALVALLLGHRLVVAGVGQARAVLLQDGESKSLLACTSDVQSGAERERIEEARGVIQEGLVYRRVEGLDEARRILAAKSAFEVLQLETALEDEKQVRTAYKRLALRVHPDKIVDGADKEAFNKAFARLEAAKEAVEVMLAEDMEACCELHQVLRAEVYTREGAAELLSVDKTAMMDTELLAKDAELAAKNQIKKLAKMERFAAEYARGVAMCEEAVETIRRPCTAEALPRHEALLRVGVSTTRGLGLRDLRTLSAIVKMEPEAACWHVPTDKECRLALLCGATAALDDAKLVSSSKSLQRQPRAAALKWCLDADPSAPSTGAVCIRFNAKGTRRDEAAASQAAKRQKVAGQPDAIMLRHILIKHNQLKTADPFARRDGGARTMGEAEARALDALERLQAAGNASASQLLFLQLCRELSDCQTADQPGQLTGNMGWVARGEQEAAFEEAAFVLEPNEFSDVIATSRGIHVVQRLG